MSAPSVMAPVMIRAPISSGGKTMARLPNMTSCRRSDRSARMPARGEKIRVGQNWAENARAIRNCESVSELAAQPTATYWAQKPSWETMLPRAMSRKSRWRRTARPPKRRPV